MRPSTLVIAFGAGRALVGVALLAAPAPIARGWVGVDGTPATVLSRSLGARDLVLGAGLALATARGGDPRLWLAGGVLADTVDGVATVAAGDDIPRNGRVATTALAGGSALFGAWLARAID
ncbi:MAG: hypothetical protein ACXVFM_23855 [Solirubrobacteraceae bacterium]